MEQYQVPGDDLIDVMEMTKKIETYISRVLKENDLNLAMSALMSASINCMLAPCKSLDEVMFYRNLFMQVLDSTIRNIEIKPPKDSFF